MWLNIQLYVPKSCQLIIITFKLCHLLFLKTDCLCLLQGAGDTRAKSTTSVECLVSKIPVSQPYFLMICLFKLFIRPSVWSTILKLLWSYHPHIKNNKTKCLPLIYLRSDNELGPMTISLTLILSSMAMALLNFWNWKLTIFWKHFVNWWGGLEGESHMKPNTIIYLHCLLVNVNSELTKRHDCFWL